MTALDPLSHVRQQLEQKAGGYLRNLALTASCLRCYTPLPATGLCTSCSHQVEMAGMPDVIGFMTYATHAAPVPQSGRTMRAYKYPVPVPLAVQIVEMLTAIAVRGHVGCPGRLVGLSVTRWASVPSLPPKPGTVHPLNAVLARLAKTSDAEIRLQGADQPVSDPRALDATNYRVLDAVPPGTHVLLVDDTWASGGHVQAAALSLRAVGAARVSVLVLARWLTEGWGHTTPAWLRTHLTKDYNPEFCPYTQGPCPPSP